MWYFIAEHKGNGQAGLDRKRMTNQMTPTQMDNAQAIAIDGSIGIISMIMNEGQ